MPSFKSILFGLFVVLALAGGVWAYLKLRQIKQPSEDALQRLPAGCSVYLHTNNLFELNSCLNTRSLIVDKFSELPPLSETLKTLELFCLKSAEQPVLEETFNGNSVHFAAYPEKKYWLISFNLKELGQERLFQTAFSETFKAKKIDTEHYSFEMGSSATLFLSFQKGGICISNSRAALEAALDRESPRLKQDSTFLVCTKEFENDELLNIYLAHEKIKKENSSIGFNLLQNTGFTSGQLEVQPSQLILNGTLYSGKDPVLEALLKQKPSEAELQLMLPNNCIAFKAYGFQDYSALTKHHTSFSNTNAFWAAVKDSAMFDLESGFYKNITTAVCQFSLLETPSSFFVCVLSDTLKANEQLRFMSDSVFSQPEGKIYRINKQTKTPVLFEPLSSVSCAYAFVYESYLYFGQNAEALLSVFQSMHAGKTFEKNPALMAYARDQFPEEFSLLVYTSPSALPQNIKAFYPSAKNADEQEFSGLKHASLSLSAQEKNFGLRWQCAVENEAEESGEKLLWTLKLDTTCSMKAQEFTNHLSGEQELLVQDDANTLYLINSKGKILWKKPLKEKIRSKIYMVDMFRNRKLQMLFSTDNYIHLIDRNSIYVETYPVKVPAKITSPLCVFDYDKNRDYRLFFACSNKKIYNYTVYGIRNQRFTPVKTVEEVQQPIQYVKVGLSDYLLAIDREGRIYAISRKGDLRLQLNNRTLVPCRGLYVDASNSLQSTKLIFLDENEEALHKISLADKKEILNLKNGGTTLCFNFALVDENRNMDLLVARKEKITAYNLNGNRLFDTKLSIELSELDFYSDQNHSVYYGWSQSSAELYLYENRKNEERILKANAMPLLSNLFKNNKIYLVYPEYNKLNCLAY